MSSIPKKFHQHPQLAGDTRERKFSLLSLFRPEYEPTAVTARRTFQQADYGIPGFSGIEHGDLRLVIWERKTISDLYGCMGGERERFADELQRLQEYRYASIMVAGTWADLFAYAARMGGGISHAAIISTLRSWRVNDKMHIYFGESEEGIAREIEAEADIFWQRQVTYAKRLIPKRGEEARL